ncbi:HAD family hydrolase [Stutzerimonas nosocomialis]|uniref:HAD family hydrolase n=1 Tax=Stutzerimonas nosocomialis TaxID=1056496 RepID=UPI001108949D|nr:HAD family hydrolase [Stutzerimonas nosocomialis]TLX60772.1 HAD family hydrolase [Stutzerimonas nosocomialis]
MSAFDLLISDCDGVIVDSEILSKRVLFEALCAYAPAARLGPLLEDTFGLTVPTIVRLVEQTFDLSIPETFDEDVRRQSEAYVAEAVEPVAGAREALLGIDMPLAVASNSRRHNVEASLARAGLTERVAGNIFSADMVVSPKPAPDVYLLAAERMGVAPARCLVVEDSPTGVRAALGAGMRVIGFTGASHIPPGHAKTLLDLGVVAVIEHMDRLQETVTRLRG